jgi:hypothetical protein
LVGEHAEITAHPLVKSVGEHITQIISEGCMVKANGYVLNVRSHRRVDLLDAMEDGVTPAVAVPKFEHSSNVPLIGFIGFQRGLITHLADARPGLTARTKLRRLNLHNIVKLPEPVHHRDILARIDSRLRGTIERRLHAGGLLAPASFAAVVDAVRQLSPASRRSLDRFSEQRRSRIERLPTEIRDALAYQKETVTTALAFAGLDRHMVQDWNPPPDDTDPYAASPSFLHGLPYARLREDSMIEHDMRQVPGFELVQSMPFGAAVFENNDTRLTVINVNRGAAEGQFGADLIYYNETYKSFVMIQYKAMETEDDEAIFRLPNNKLARQIGLMNSTLNVLRQCVPSGDRPGFRMMENPFFIKLCARLTFNPDDAGLVNGMYLPLDYWHLIESDTSLVGPKGGRQVTFDNVGRYLDNTRFIGLMTSAWIGTTPSQSAVLRPLIQEMIHTNRPFTIAVKTATKAADFPAAH